MRSLSRKTFELLSQFKDFSGVSPELICVICCGQVVEGTGNKGKDLRSG